MCRKLLCLMALPALAAAGTIIQADTLFDDQIGQVETFWLPGYRLTGVEAIIRTGVFFLLQASFDSASGIPLDPPAKLTATGYASVKVLLPGLETVLKTDVACESFIYVTDMETDAGCQGGYAEYHLIGDPRLPLWTVPLMTFAVGTSGGEITSMNCEPGVPAIPCSVREGFRPIGDAKYELIYTYAPIPEPSPRALVGLALALGSVSILRWRRRRRL